MKVAVTAIGPALDADMAVRFGRGAYFIVVDVDTLGFDVSDNPSITLDGDEGIRLSGILAKRHVNLVLAAYWTPYDYRTISSATIQAATVSFGTVRSAVEQVNRCRFIPPIKSLRHGPSPASNFDSISMSNEGVGQAEKELLLGGILC